MIVKYIALSLQMIGQKKKEKKTRMIESLRLMTFMINIQKTRFGYINAIRVVRPSHFDVIGTSRTVFVGPKQIF